MIKAILGWWVAYRFRDWDHETHYRNGRWDFRATHQKEPNYRVLVDSDTVIGVWRKALYTLGNVKLRMMADATEKRRQEKTVV